MKTTVIIPTYNESENIKAIIDAVFTAVPSVDILVVDDNSPDGTAEIVNTLKSKYPNLAILNRKGKEGLGKAYMNAFQEVLKDSSVDTVIMMDADFSHDPKNLADLIKLREQYDVVVGSRYIKGGGTVGWELWRRIISQGGGIYSRLITGLPVHDCTGGFNAISTKFLRRVNFEKIDASGYAFQIELKYNLFKLGAKFIETPIIFKNRVTGESKITNFIIREGILAPWRMRLRK